MLEKNWQFELEEYIKRGEPGKVEKSEVWQTAIGLQAVDGLNTSEYLLDTAKEHIEGNITIDEAQKRIQSYYEHRTERTEVEDNTKEADIVSVRIAKLLGEKSFQFSPAERPPQTVRGGVRPRRSDPSVQHHKKGMGAER